MWIALLKRYWQVTIFKETPENTPCSSFLLTLIALCYYLFIVLQWIIANLSKTFGINSAFVAGAALIASYVIYTGVLLLAFHLKNRIKQTLTCILAGHTIIHVIAFPLLLVTPLLADTTIPQPLGLLLGVAYLILTLILTVWQFMVSVHIYKHALSVDYVSAVLASFGLLACNILIISFWR